MPVWSNLIETSNFKCSESPKGTNEKCPRKNGFFAHPNRDICHIFYNCVDGDAIEVICTAGLHFDEYSGTCVWPDTANREGCKTGDRKFDYLITKIRLISKKINVFFFQFLSQKRASKR